MRPIRLSYLEICRLRETIEQITRSYRSSLHSVQAGYVALMHFIAVRVYEGKPLDILALT